MGCSKSSLKREVYSNTILPQEKEKHQTLHLKQQKNRKKNKKTKISRRKEIKDPSRKK